MPNGHIVAKLCYVQKLPVGTMKAGFVVHGFIQQIFWYFMTGLLPTLILCAVYFREHIPRTIRWFREQVRARNLIAANNVQNGDVDNNPHNNAVDQQPQPYIAGAYEGPRGYISLLRHIASMYYKFAVMLIIDYAPQRGEYAFRQLRRKVRHSHPEYFLILALGSDEGDDAWLGNTNWQLRGEMTWFNNYYIWPMTHNQMMFFNEAWICLPEFETYVRDDEMHMMEVDG
ncbi:hypothetical protein P280DRAFT_516251 [Massarina eburnea CBS 473.64]|uniref:Uncharacterized protein n=1 Tax=Massarina eburnea CBS 473.64 TaxID=1395130 RepID=A0A6A6S449_9PLEO|nr:hypothetical protein P280DRAFT_516251 [Massarina eburnea CBS 473.64]